MQFVALESPFVVVPLGHLTGSCFVLGHMYPSGQSVQFVCPNNAYVPAGHGEIADAGLGQEYPRGQRTHSAIAKELYEPDGQFCGARAGSRHDWPAGHDIQLVFPPVEYVPFPHGTGVDNIDGH